MEEPQIKQIIKQRAFQGTALLDPRCKLLLFNWYWMCQLLLGGGLSVLCLYWPMAYLSLQEVVWDGL